MTTGKQSSDIEPKKTGSPRSGEPVYLMIGKLRRSHGIHGEMLMDVQTDFPERIKVGNHVFVGQKHKELIISGLRPMNKDLLVGFDGYGDCEQVAIYCNQPVYIKTESVSDLPEGEFYHHEVVGMSVVDEAEKPIGIILEILVTGANDVYVIESPAGEEILVPAIKSVVISISREKHKMVVRLPEWG
jgi:16S rRNA processing protein RimM